MVYVPKALRDKITKQAKHRCGYCLSQELIIGMAMTVDHIIPSSIGGENVEKNLWLACVTCNDTKNNRTHEIDPVTGNLVVLFNPRTQIWIEHFEWSEDKSLVIGKTPTGNATVIALNLNRPKLVASRLVWTLAGWHPPKD
jgi:HNH endonuclease